jgi:hypothetical protein
MERKKLATVILNEGFHDRVAFQKSMQFYD